MSFIFPSTKIIYQCSIKKISRLDELAEASKSGNILEPAENQEERYNALIVLSQQVFPNGELTALTRGRVKKGAELLAAKKADFMIMAGRDMHTGKNLPLAELMWKYAFSLGVSEYDQDGRENISRNIEDKATDTQLQIFCFLRDHVLTRGWKNFLIVTDDYQMLGKSAAYTAFFSGNDFNVGYAMQDTLPIFQTQEKREEVLKKQFNSLDLAVNMYRGLEGGVKNHPALLKRMFEEHDRYRGQNPRNYMRNVPLS